MKKVIILMLMILVFGCTLEPKVQELPQTIVEALMDKSCRTCTSWEVYLVSCPGEENTLLCRKKRCTNWVDMPGYNCGP